MNFMRSALAGVVFVAGATLAGTVQATPVITTNGDLKVTVGQNNSPGEVKIYLDKKTDTQTVTGHVGSQTGTPLVTFTTDVNVDAKNGFASIDAASNLWQASRSPSRRATLLRTSSLIS
jgi:hypothetical protein